VGRKTTRTGTFRCERSAPLAADLRALLPFEPRSTALEWFIGSCLTEAGVWDDPRTSDGIGDFGAVFENGPNRLCFWSRIWRIDGQTLHTFWLEVTRERQCDQFAWFLYFDAPEDSGRRRPRAFDRHDAAEEIEWRARIVGEAIVQDEKLAIVPGSTRALIRDVPEPELPPERSSGRQRRHRRR